MMPAFLNNLSVDMLAMGLVMAALLSVMAGFLAISVAANRSRQRKMDRLNRACNRKSVRVAAVSGPTVLLNSNENKFEKLTLRYLPNPEKLRARLHQTGRSIRPVNYLMLMGALSLIMLMVLLVVFKAPVFVAIMGGVAAGVFFPHVVTGVMINSRRNAFLKNFPEAIDIMVRGLKAGLPVTESIGAVGREAVQPVSGVFQDVANKIRVGESLEDAITSISAKMNVAEFKFLAITLSVQKETGGNLSETLGNLSDILRKRRFMKLKIKAVSSEARASATILGSLPFVMFCLISVVSPDYMVGLFEDPRGHIMVGIGLLLMTIGSLIMGKMVRFEI